MMRSASYDPKIEKAPRSTSSGVTNSDMNEYMNNYGEKGPTLSPSKLSEMVATPVLRSATANSHEMTPDQLYLVSVDDNYTYAWNMVGHILRQYPNQTF